MKRSSFLAAFCALGAAVASAQTPPPSSPAPTPGGTTPPPVETKMVLPEIKSRGKLRAGVKFDVPLFGLSNPVARRVEGFDVDIARELAKALLGSADKIELIETVSASRIPFVQEEKVDIVISTMTINEDRKKVVDFSDVYYIAGQSLLVPKGSPIKGVKDLAGKIVTTVQGSTPERELMRQVPNCKPLLLKGYSECFAALENGQADAFTTDDIILMGFKSKAPDKYELVGGQFTSEPYGIAIKKGRPDLLAFVNAELAKMKTDGRWKKIYDTHLKPQTGSSVEPPK